MPSTRKADKHGDVEYTPPSERLLGDKFAFNSEDDEYYSVKVRTASRKQRLRAIAIHSFICLVYTIVFTGLWYRATLTNSPKYLVFSPGHVALKPERHIMDITFDNGSPFKGKPGPEVDHAWHELLSNSNIRVTAEELAKLNQTSVPIHDEKGGFYAVPDVYHQLHCLKYLRRIIYNDYYQINTSTKSMHIDHCIDSIRQSLMCSADMALVTYEWVPKYSAPEPRFKVEHECANWQMVDNWAKSRGFDIFDENTLIHPTLGPAFPQKDYDQLGKFQGSVHEHDADRQDAEHNEHAHGGHR